MKRTARNNTPYVKPVIKAELSEKNPKMRFILAIVLVAIAGCAFIYALMSYLGKESGWTTIVARSDSERNCSDEFVFQYFIGASGASASVENKEIQSLYTEATVKAYQLFNSDEVFEGVNNMAYINQHPNEEIEVDKVLYEAFSKLDASGIRNLYLGPVYEAYNGLFSCTEDAMTYDFDPAQNEDVKTFISQSCQYVNNPDAIQLELLGDCKVRLKVSDEYLSFAKQNQVTDYIDFYWMKNAFIVDYLADVMVENNYKFGSISSYNGFVRNLDESDNSYSYNLYDRDAQTVYSAGIMEYEGAHSIVYLRNYRMTELDDQYFYEFQNGDMRTAFISTEDGMDQTSVNNMVSYSTNQGCADILLRMVPVYLSNSFDEAKVESWKADGINSIYYKDHMILYNEDSLSISNLFDEDGVTYTKSFVE